jgi:hypothetical protein
VEGTLHNNRSENLRSYRRWDIPDRMRISLFFAFKPKVGPNELILGTVPLRGNYIIMKLTTQRQLGSE